MAGCRRTAVGREVKWWLPPALGPRHKNRTLADWKQRVRAAWPKVDLRLLTDTPSELPRQQLLAISIAVSLVTRDFSATRALLMN